MAGKSGEPESQPLFGAESQVPELRDSGSGENAPKLAKPADCRALEGAVCRLEACTENVETPAAVL